MKFKRTKHWNRFQRRKSELQQLRRRNTTLNPSEISRGLINMQYQFLSMWVNHFAPIIVAKHRIKTTPDDPLSVTCRPYQEGSQAQIFGWMGTGKVLESSVIVLTQKSFAGPIVFARTGCFILVLHRVPSSKDCDGIRPISGTRDREMNRISSCSNQNFKFRYQHRILA